LAALLVGPASAADIVVRPIARAPQPVLVNPLAFLFRPVRQIPIGVAGARWEGQCWVDRDNARYAGYWGPCPKPQRARIAGKPPIVAKY
jgi:hypothetical protein